MRAGVIAAAAMMSAAFAQAPEPPRAEPTDAERAQLNACIDSAEPWAHPARLSCSGLVSGPCLNSPAGQTTAGSIVCLQRETAIWDSRLNTAYREFMASLRALNAETRIEALRSAQRAWIAYRDQECEQQSLLHEGGSLARVELAACIGLLTARRAVELEAQAADLEL